MIGDSETTDCLGLAGEVFSSGMAWPSRGVGSGTADRRLLMLYPAEAMGRYGGFRGATLSRVASRLPARKPGEGGDPTSELVLDVPPVVTTVPACDVWEVRVVLKLFRTLLSCWCSTETTADELREGASEVVRFRGDTFCPSSSSFEASISIPSIVAVSDSSCFSSSTFGDGEGDGVWNGVSVGEGTRKVDNVGDGNENKACVGEAMAADLAGDVTFVTLAGFRLTWYRWLGVFFKSVALCPAFDVAVVSR